MSDIYIFSMLKWHSDLLHSSHMLAKYFVKNGSKVCYVEKSNTLNVFKWGKYDYIEDEVNQLVIYGIPYLKGHFTSAFRLNDIFIKSALKKHFTNVKNSEAIALISTPHWSRAVDSVNAFKNRIFYDISDDYLAFAGNNHWHDLLLDYEKKAIEISKKQFITIETLQDKVSNEGILIENGVDLSQFALAKDKEFNYNGKVIGFIGGLYDWIDFGLIAKVAKDNPDDTILLIGPTNAQATLEMILNIPNIKYLGPIDKDQIHDYFASFDIGIIPFLSELEYPRLKTVNSNKVFQYLYFNYPIVTTAFTQVNAMEDILYVSKSHEEFLKNIKSAKEENKSKISFDINKISWDEKAKEMLKHLKEEL